MPNNKKRIALDYVRENQAELFGVFYELNPNIAPI
jgi:hypothetical protein